MPYRLKLEDGPIMFYFEGKRMIIIMLAYFQPVILIFIRVMLFLHMSYLKLLLYADVLAVKPTKIIIKNVILVSSATDISVCKTILSKQRVRLTFPFL